MKRFPTTFGLFTAVLMPAMAVEPPIEPEAIPPQQPPVRDGRDARPAEEDPRQQQDQAAPRNGRRDGHPKARPIPQADAAGERPYIGVILDPVSGVLASHLRLKDDQGLVIIDLVGGGPAAEAGLKVHDVLVKVEGQAVDSLQTVRELVNQHEVGDEVELDIFRRGERERVKLALGAAPPQMPRADRGQRHGGDPFLQGLPEKHAEMIREALERNLRGFDDPAGGRDMAAEMERRMQRLQQMMDRGMQMEMDVDAETSVRLVDEQGSIEMKVRDGQKVVRVFDSAGDLVWEGPYDTEQDKAAVPDDIRERIERLNFSFEDGGIQFRNERFRRLEDMRPKEAPDGD